MTFVSRLTGETVDDPIRYIVETSDDSEGYYNLQKMFAKAADDTVLFFIVGSRRIGKTLKLQYIMCRLWIEFGLMTMWLRNKKVEFDDSDFRTNFLNACKRLHWCPDEWIVDRAGVRTAAEKDGGELVCLFESINTFSNRRGNEQRQVQMMVLDEMMPEDRRYPPRAHTGLMSLTMTVFSGRPGTRLFCLSNFVSSGNPYFAGYRVFPDEGKDITVFPEKSIAIEVCRGYRRAIEEVSPWNKVYAAGGYSDYSDADEDKLFELIKRTPKGAAPSDIVLRIGQMDYRPFSKDGIYYFQPNGLTLQGSCIYTPDLEQTGKSAQLIPKWLHNQLVELSINNLMRFKDPNTMFDVLHVIYETV